MSEEEQEQGIGPLLMEPVAFFPVFFSFFFRPPSQVRKGSIVIIKFPRGGPSEGRGGRCMRPADLGLSDFCLYQYYCTLCTYGVHARTTSD